MAHYDLLLDLLILFGFASLVAVLLQRARQSTIVAYLLTGMLVGPSGLGLITNRDAIELMAEIGVVLLLFTIGIEFSLKKLLKMRQVVLGAGSRQVVLTIVVSLAVALLLGFPWRQSFLWGFLIAASSTGAIATSSRASALRRFENLESIQVQRDGQGAAEGIVGVGSIL